MAFAKNDVSASDAQEIQKLVTSAQQQGSPDCYTGKRRWMRFTAGMRLEITTDPGVPSDSLHVTMQNVSEGGFSFWSKQELNNTKTSSSASSRRSTTGNGSRPRSVIARPAFAVFSSELNSIIRRRMSNRETP